MSISSPIRILHVVPNMQSGGLETLIMNIYRNIDRTKIQFDFLVHYEKEKFYDSEIISLGGKIHRSTLRDDNNIFKYKKFLNHFFNTHKEYQIVHCHMSSIVSTIFPIARKHGVKHLIAHSHNSQTEPTLKGKIKKFLIRNVAKYSTCNFACSNLAGKFLFKNKDYEIIENAIEIEKFKFSINTRHKIRHELNIDDDCFVIGNIGRLNIQKNQMFLIDVFEEYLKLNANGKLLIIGSGEKENQLRQYIKDKQLNNKVILLGSRKDVNEFYNAMDCFVLTSLFEGLPLVAIEAQTNGVNCFFSDRITKEVKLVENVTFLPINDAENFAKNINNSIYNLEERDSFYLEIAKTNYNIKLQAKNLTQKYLYLLEQNNI